jgi:hypothetical protein
MRLRVKFPTARRSFGAEDGELFLRTLLRVDVHDADRIRRTPGNAFKELSNGSVTDSSSSSGAIRHR